MLGTLNQLKVTYKFLKFYRENAVSDSMIRRLVWNFSEGREIVQDEEQSGRQSLMMISLQNLKRRLRRTEDLLLLYCQCIFLKFPVHFFTKLYPKKWNFENCVLGGYRKISSEQHRTKRQVSALQCFIRYNDEDGEFLKPYRHFEVRLGCLT